MTMFINSTDSILSVMTKKHLHTVESPIVGKMYSMVAPLMTSDMFFSGGMSAQLFLPDKFRRGSSDIDINGLQRFKITDFENFMNPVVSCLKVQGYDFNFKKRHYTFDMTVSNSDEVIIIQYPKRTVSAHQRMEKNIERECAHTEMIPYADEVIRVISAEDLLARKLLRSETFKKNYNLTTPVIDNLEDALDEINVLKEDYTINRYNFDPQEVARYVAKIRLFADTFDIVAIANFCHLDKNYFSEVVDDYRVLKPQKESLIDMLNAHNNYIFR